MRTSTTRAASRTCTKNGYRGPIYTTDATRDLCAIMLEDSAHIQESDAEWKNRKAMRSGAEMIEPDYTVEDAQNVMKQFVPCPYEAWQTLFDGPTGKIEMRFTDVGHLLGSASVSRCALRSRAARRRSSFFSGDIGNTHQPLIRTRPTRATRVTLSWNPPTGTAATAETGLYRRFERRAAIDVRQGRQCRHPQLCRGPHAGAFVFYPPDQGRGPYQGPRKLPGLCGQPAGEQIHHDLPGKTLPSATTTKPSPWCRAAGTPAVPGSARQRDEEESMAINGDPTPKVIISAAGMCDAGRIRHHLKYNLWRPECTVLFVGYQSPGTLGNAGQRCAGGQALWRAGAGQGPHCAAGRAFWSRRQGRAGSPGSAPLTKSRSSSLSTTARTPSPSTGPTI